MAAFGFAPFWTNNLLPGFDNCPKPVFGFVIGGIEDMFGIRVSVPSLLEAETVNTRDEQDGAGCSQAHGASKEMLRGANDRGEALPLAAETEPRDLGEATTGLDRSSCGSPLVMNRARHALKNLTLP